jgi:signal transduction histidine kinase
MKKQYPPSKASSPERRAVPRGRALVMALVLLILGLFLLYAVVAIRTTEAIERRQTLERNQATALLGARLIDAQLNTTLSVLRALARRRGLAAALRQDASAPRGGSRRAAAAHLAAIAAHLRDAVELVPDIALVAAYGPDGARIACVPRAPAPAASAAGTEWFERLRRNPGSYIGDIDPLEDENADPVVTLAVPVGEAARPAGYLVAPFRPEVIRTWLEPVELGTGGILYATDTTGRILAGSTPLARPGRSLSQYRAIRHALQGGHGTLETFSPVLQQQALVGYAHARLSSWAVVAAQPTDVALAPVRHLLQRLSLLLLPFVALMGAAGWTIQSLYSRQARLMDQVREAERFKSSILENVSHSLGTPLVSMKGTVSGILEPDTEWSEVAMRGLLSLVNEEIDRLAAQVQNLLDMSRIEAKGLAPSKEVCDLTEIAAAAREKAALLTRGRPVAMEFPSEPLLVEADGDQIETVIRNLLENAVKYTLPEGRLVLRGEARPAPAGGPAGEVRVSLRDHGPGVPPGEEARIFEKFYRAPSGPAVPGTGLGLAICKAIITAHGGAIGVRPAPGGGAEFWFTLPRYPEAGSFPRSSHRDRGRDEATPDPGRGRRSADPADAEHPALPSRL